MSRDFVQQNQGGSPKIARLHEPRLSKGQSDQQCLLFASGAHFGVGSFWSVNGDEIAPMRADQRARRRPVPFPSFAELS